MDNKGLMQKILGMFQKPEKPQRTPAIQFQMDRPGEVQADFDPNEPMRSDEELGLAPLGFVTQPDADGVYRAKDPQTGESLGSEPMVESYRDGEYIPFRVRPLKKAAPKVSGIEVQKEKVKLLKSPGKLVKRLMGPEE